MKDFKKIIGRRIAIERRKCGLSQEQLAELVGVHRTYIGTVERGEKNISLMTVRKFTLALKLPLEALFKGY